MRGVCRCGRKACYVITRMSDGAEREVCDDEECEWHAHCRLLDLPYQAPGVLLRPEGAPGYNPP